MHARLKKKTLSCSLKEGREKQCQQNEEGVYKTKFKMYIFEGDRIFLLTFPYHMQTIRSRTFVSRHISDPSVHSIETANF